MVELPWTATLDGVAPLPAELGGKGAALDRLVGWGIDVPPTGAVLASVSRAIADRSPVRETVTAVRAGTRVDAAEVDRAFLDVDLPPGVESQVIDLARRIGGGMHLAVRSSATAEDLERTSFAGQYRSILDVDPDDGPAVLRAVRLVLASAWHPAPVAYRRVTGVGDDDVAMAVLLMRMVPASLAGVVFTSAPEDPGSARVEVVTGLADDLVSGRVTPRAALVPRAGTTEQGSGPASEQGVMADAAAIALQIEVRAGRPQDVEWAWDGDRLWIVQARPITTIDVESDPFDTPEALLEQFDLTTLGIGETLPGVLPPLLWDVGRHLVEESFRAVFAALGSLPPDLDAPAAFVWRVHGRAAMDFALYERAAGRVPGAAADEIEAQYFGSRRSGRAAVERSQRSRVRAVLHDLRVATTRERALLDAEVVCRVADALDGSGRVAASWAEADDAVLAATHLGLIDLGTRAMTAELAVAAGAVAAYRRLELLLARRLDAAAAGALAGAATAAAGTTVRPSPLASAAFFGGATWQELGRQPVPATAATAPAATAPAAASLAVLAEALDARAPGASPGSLWRRSVRRALIDAVAQLHARERTKAAVLRIGGEVRALHGEIGRRSAARGLLRAPEEIELLTVAELQDALFGGPVPVATELAARRRQLSVHQRRAPLPVRFRGVPQTEPLPAGLDDRFEGWAASAGRASGAACIVEDPDAPFRDGDVLVAVATDPSWSPLLARAGAIVLERGGPLSHAAILARELGVPAVLNVAGATARFAGRRLLVDGDAGVVVDLGAVAPEPEGGAS